MLVLMEVKILAVAFVAGLVACRVVLCVGVFVLGEWVFVKSPLSLIGDVW